jgi:hypothetical protein
MTTTTVELKKEQEQQFDQKLEAVAAGLSGEYSSQIVYANTQKRYLIMQHFSIIKD